MQVIYVPRIDAGVVSGGDVEHARYFGKSLRFIEVQMNRVELDELAKCRGADAVYLTQIYQIDAAEAVMAWAAKTKTPIFISPLFEESLRQGYRLALQGKGNWYRLSRALGRRAAESLFLARDTWLRSRRELWQRQRKLLLQAHLLPNTQYELNHLISWFRLRDVQATIVPLGIDPALFNPEAGERVEHLPENILQWRGEYLLQVGLISSRKNQIGLLTALKDSDIPLVFVGRPSPYEPEYHAELIRRAKARGNVAFFDRVSVETLAALYGQAAAHVLPSWSERPGLATLEAAACGCNVVSTKTAPIWEYLGDEVFLCAPQSSEEIRRAALNAVERLPSAELANRVLANYTWSQTANYFKEAVKSD